MTKTRLAAIMFTDIVGYTAMMQENRQDAMDAIKQFEEVLRTRIDQHEGELLQTYGDGSLSIFESASAAVLCAKEIQEEIRGNVPLRIGIHLGEITRDGEHTFGDGVNIASRIESMGVAGAVLVSSSIRQQIKNNPAFELESMGKFAFKNVAEPMTVFALSNTGIAVPKAEEMKGKGQPLSPEKPTTKSLFRMASIGFVAMILGASLFWFFSAKQPATPDLAPEAVRASRIAILPFENFTNDPELDIVGKMAANWIADGLMSIEDIKVVSAGNVRSHLHQAAPKTENSANEAFARATGAEKLILGSMFKTGDSLILKSKVIDAISGEFNYAFPTIIGNISEPTRIVEELMQRILTYYAINEDDHPTMFSKANKAPKLTAFKAFSRGLDAFGVDYQEAIRYFRQAQELDEGFSFPYLWTITSFSNQGMYREADSVLSVLQKKFPLPNVYEQHWINWAEALLRGNLETQYHVIQKLFILDPKDPVIVYLAGLYAFRINRVRECVSVMQGIELETALDNPNVTKNTIYWMYLLYSESLIRLGRFEEARRKLRSLPTSFYNPEVWAELAKIAVYMEESDSLQAILERVRYSGGESEVFAAVGITYAFLGKQEKQVTWFQKAIDAYQPRRTATDAPPAWYQYAGRPNEALNQFQQELDRTPSLSNDRKVFLLGKIGLLHARVGKETEAQQILDQLEALTYPYSHGRPTYMKACILANMGQETRSIQLLKQAYQEGQGFDWYGKYYRDLDLQPIWNKPAFVTFVKPR